MIEPARRAARTAMLSIGCMGAAYSKRRARLVSAGRPAGEDDLAYRLSRLDAGVRRAQVRGVDGREPLARRGADFVRVDPSGHSREQPVLLDHVGGAEVRAR